MYALVAFNLFCFFSFFDFHILWKGWKANNTIFLYNALLRTSSKVNLETMFKDAHCRLCGSDIETLTTLHRPCSKFRLQYDIHASLGLDISTDDSLHSDMICRNCPRKLEKWRKAKKKKKKKKKIILVRFQHQLFFHRPSMKPSFHNDLLFMILHDKRT